MSVSTLAHPPHHKTALTKFWVGVLLLVAAGLAIAWIGAQSVRSRTVQVETLEAGTGPTIEPVDGVIIEYEGRLRDGTVFDASAQHGGPQPLLAGQVIPGFAEALTKMRKGGRYRARIPAHLAYGDAEQPGIPPNSDLVFDIHIVDIAPNAALMMGPQGAPPQAAPEPMPQGR